MVTIQRMYRNLARKKYKPRKNKLKNFLKHCIDRSSSRLLLLNNNNNVSSSRALVPYDNNITSKSSSKRRVIEFGIGVKMLFRNETEDLLKQKNPCTLYELALTWEKSTSLNIAVRIDKNLEKITSTSKMNEDEEDLTSILKGMQQLSISHTTRIRNWSEAEDILSKEGVVFTSDENNDDDKTVAAKSLETFKHMVRQKTQKSMERIKSFRMRMFDKNRLKEVAMTAAAISEDDKKKGQEEGKSYQEKINRILEEKKKLLGMELDDDEEDYQKELEAKKNASKLLRPLTEEESQIVKDAVHGIGPPSDTMAQINNDIVVRESMNRLQPRQWLNDEVIHYFLLMLSKRDETLKKERSHFFKSYFMTKLLNEGHASLDGKYEYRNVKRWSKKVPGKDLFALNKVLFPINQGNAHWVCAVIYMKDKRIQMYDSLGGSGKMYLEYLFQYLQDEHLDKKKIPLPGKDEWKLVPTQNDTPRQENGFDCGVFTCMFADFLSNDCPLLFTQEHITQCRERIALSIMKGSALID
eukprot:CAMPEP_0194187994 /NCGR_PEP_ID=MMETSP0154-20130528/53139_1 /TAXON_ID=1049557 /ORGANISM="Thalassiothrix antarctica, Strain L6-D1" /LENGTH=524 /DNA_ID=CAMNT_0038908091 /DNA_START=51 /DNA_END=1625 /DNA_ORIENTATION=-